MLNTNFGTGKHNFGYMPDPPEPEEFECYGDCSLCKWAEVHKDGRYICCGDEFESKEED